MLIARVFATFALSGYAAIVAYMSLFQRSFLYQPDTERVAPSAAGLRGFEEQILETPDGARVIAWWTPPKPGRPVVVYFHGNGGNISYRAARAQFFQEQGCGALMVEYRGYGGSTGLPSEQAFMEDGRQMLDRLAARGYPSTRLVLFGESLGSGIAVALAAERPVAALILDSPYTALVDVAARRMPFVPVHLLMLDRFESISKISKVHAPLLVIHGDQDDVVPFEMGERMYQAANGPKSFVRLKGAGHVSPLNEQSKPAIRRLLQALN